MAVNFSSENLVKISCDQVSSDHHDVQNLISCNETNRQKGFLVEYYIRPPVTIKIEFTKHNCDLMYLELGLQVRQHRSRGIEVHTVSSHNSYTSSQLILKCFNLNHNKLAIVNGGYRPNRHLPQVNETTVPERFSIAGRNIKFCNNVSCILIKILSTENSTVPCLSSLEIFGKPSGLGAGDLRTFVNSLEDNKIEHISSVNLVHRVEPVRDLSQQIEHLAPIEFFDAITNELMRIPYLLPSSGKNIDKQTLNKYLATKNDYNPPSDPFTRMPFSDQNKPHLNAELKARIDLFFSTNGQSEIDRRNELRRRLLNLP